MPFEDPFRRSVLVLAIALTVFRMPSLAGEIGDPRGIVVEQVRNDQPNFLVRVDVNQRDRVYNDGEELRARVVSARDGFLYLLYCDASKSLHCLFPNEWGQDNSVRAMEEVDVPRSAPPGQATFRLRIAPPYGEEVLKAVITSAPLSPETLGRLIAPGDSAARLEGVRRELASRGIHWADHHVIIHTIERPATSGSTTPPPALRAEDDPSPVVPTSPDAGRKRVGVFIGISDYRDPQIRDLKVAHKDAIAMAEVMRKRCRLDDVSVLLNKQATLANIHEVFVRHLPQSTRPGDTVVVFWSGHGSRCADDEGDERDGFDEYLVPHDGDLANLDTIRSTMLMDDTFGRWVQELDGRRLLVILDTCHSGGQNAQEKSLGKGLFRFEPKGAGTEFDFLDGEFARIKDIGQRETALLASSRASQVSFERREEDLSIMTYFLVGMLTNAHGQVTLTEAFADLQRQVAAYVERAFPGTTQTPVLINNLSPPFYLLP